MTQWVTDSTCPSSLRSELWNPDVESAGEQAHTVPVTSAWEPGHTHILDRADSPLLLPLTCWAHTTHHSHTRQDDMS